MPNHPKSITRIATTSPDGGGLIRHFVYDRPGIIVRTFMPGLIVEVAILRHGNRRPTFQGVVSRGLDGYYTASTPDRRAVTTTATNYVVAEKALIGLRTGRRSTVTYQWPADLLSWFRNHGKEAMCGVCGHELVAGQCCRLDLH